MINLSNSKLIEGLEKLVTAVESTLGPCGRIVIIKKEDKIIPTKDGVTAAKNIFLEDIQEAIGATIVTTAAEETADMAGDGTTTATILCGALVKEGSRAINIGAHPISISEGIDIGVSRVVTELKKRAIQPDKEMLVNIATISANNDSEIGQIVAEAVIKTGKHGLVKMERSETHKTYIEYTSGFNIAERGYLNPAFINTVKNECVLNNVKILITDKKITNPNDIVRICEAVNQKSESLLIIAEEVSGEALGVLITNKNRLRCCAIQRPSYGFTRSHISEDIAILTGGVSFEEANIPLAKCNYEDLGSATQVVVTRDSCNIIGCEKYPEERIMYLEEQLSSMTDPIEIKSIKSRISNLAGMSAIIKIGDVTESAVAEKEYRIEDALKAVYSAEEEGIVPGGGTTYTEIADNINLVGLSPDVALGVDLVKKAILKPMQTLVENCGMDYNEVRLTINKCIKVGFNAKTKTFENLLEAGIIDPVKVSRVALENAASAAKTIITSKAILWEQ